MTRSYVLILVLLGAFFSASCGRAGSATPEPFSEAYGLEPDWNDAQKVIPLSYEQTQGQRLFYTHCVWCHADTTPGGPSNRSNLTPTPALGNDGKVLNVLSDEQLQNMIAMGGGALQRSAMMPSWSRTLTPEEIRSLVAFLRAIAQPPYVPSPRLGTQYSVR
jgi:cytochrome c oxidase cbb3-type subunit 3